MLSFFCFKLRSNGKKVPAVDMVNEFEVGRFAPALVGLELEKPHVADKCQVYRGLLTMILIFWPE